MRRFVLALIMAGAAACELDSHGMGSVGADAAADAGVDANADSGGPVVDLAMCVASIPLSARQPLGSTCAPCMCANEIDRPLITACDAECWEVLVCVGTNCDQASPDFSQCVLTLCAGIINSLSSAQPVGAVIRACGPQCNAL